MWKLDLKDTCIYKYIYDYIYIHTYIENMFVIVGLFKGNRGRQERKREG
jgi:hypothetical protein